MKKLLDILKTIADKKNPKYEIGYVLNDTNGCLIATDTRMLLIVQTDIESPNEQQMLNVHNLETLQVSGFDMNHNLPYSTAGKYPDYTRIVLTKPENGINVDLSLINAMAHLGGITGKAFDLVTFAPKLKK